MAHSKFVLPSLVSTPSDVLHVLRELEAMEDYLHQAALRKADPAHLKLPKTSKMLDEVIGANKLDLLKRVDHDHAKSALEEIRGHAPVLHISFSTDPSSAFLNKLVFWIRQNIDERALVSVGLQPNIAAGCIVRTTNKQFDLSLRESFAKSKTLLGEFLRETTPA